MKTRYKANTFTAVIRIIIGLMLIGFSICAVKRLPGGSFASKKYRGAAVPSTDLYLNTNTTVRYTTLRDTMKGAALTASGRRKSCG